MAPIPYSVRVKHHPGSTAQDIENEPDWGEGHEHRIGYRNRQGRRPGLTHAGGIPRSVDLKAVSWADKALDERQEGFEEKAREEKDQLRQRVQKGELINFRDAINNEEVGYLPERPIANYWLTHVSVIGLPSTETCRPSGRLEIRSEYVGGLDQEHRRLADQSAEAEEEGRARE